MEVIFGQPDPVIEKLLARFEHLYFRRELSRKGSLLAKPLSAEENAELERWMRPAEPKAT